MSKKTLFIAIFLFISILGLSGCGPTLPTCDSGSLMAPDLVYPDWREIVNGSTVELEWSYPDASCQPEEYEIILSQERDYSVIEITDTVDGSENTYSPSGLDIAEEYFWRVRAKVESTYGSYSHELRSFFTEPVCAPGDLAAPIQTLPVDGGIFEISYSSLEWEWPVTTCIPSSYKIEVSTASDLSITTDFGATGTPGTRWGFGSPPTPATQYYWRVAPYADGVLGPFSEIWTFYTDPVCAPSSLMAPDPIFPTEGTEFVYDAPSYQWSYPDTSCTPMGYHLQVSGALDFSSTAPIALDLKPLSTDTLWVPISTLGDCEDYYWRVAAVVNGVDGPWSTPIRFSMNAMDACVLPACTDPLDITQPILVWPGVYEIVDTILPILEWNNPGPCDPEGYAVRLSVDYDFSDNSLFGGTGSIATSWMPGVDLEPATQYWWKIAGGMGTTMGEFSSQRAFFTGPECSPLAGLVAPERYAPVDGTVLDSLIAYLRYRPGEPGCIPDGYFVNLQTDPTFSGANLLGEFGLPGTTVITDPLTDCTTYYWKVAAIQDSGHGPESDVGWFSTNESGVCPPVPAPGTASKNAFCREGTFPEHFPAIYTIEEGDFVQVIARNPFSTYLLVAIPGADGFTPLKPMQSCWTILDAIRLWGPAQVLEGLEVLIPLPTPTPIFCQSTLNQEDCEAAGGTYYPEKKYCDCP